jgi:hypothetical protein
VYAQKTLDLTLFWVIFTGEHHPFSPFWLVLTSPHFYAYVPPIYSSKEVKVIFGVVRMKVNAARSKIASITSLVLLTSLFVSIPVTAQAAACNPTSTTVGGDTVLTFSTVGNCDWEVPNGVINARVLVVGGGSSGGAGYGGLWWPQGGGGGAVVDQSSFATTPGDVLSVLQMVEPRQTILWHLVAQVVTEI